MLVLGVAAVMRIACLSTYVCFIAAQMPSAWNRVCRGNTREGINMVQYVEMNNK